MNEVLEAPVSAKEENVIDEVMQAHFAGRKYTPRTYNELIRQFKRMQIDFQITKNALKKKALWPRLTYLKYEIEFAYRYMKVAYPKNFKSNDTHDKS